MRLPSGRRAGRRRRATAAWPARGRPVRPPGIRLRAAAPAPPEKISVTTPAGASVGSNSTARRLRTASLPSGLTCLHLQASTRSKRSAERRRRSCGVRCIAGPPVEAVETEHQALLLRAPVHVGDLDLGILQMGRNDLQVVRVEGDEFQRLHLRRLHGHGYAQPVADVWRADRRWASAGPVVPRPCAMRMISSDVLLRRLT